MSPSTSRPILDWHYNTAFSFPEILEALRRLPEYIFADDFRPAMEQINERSRSGWITAEQQPDKPWRLYADYELSYGNLGIMPARARAEHNGETILAYPHGFIVILHADDSFSLSKVS